MSTLPELFNAIHVQLKNILPSALHIHADYFINYTLSHFSCKTQIIAQEQALWLKLEHSYKVLENTAKILTELQLVQNIDSNFKNAALLAALYHDIGRFYQYKKWQTFSDEKSINHGQLSCAIVKKHGFLEHETSYVQKQSLSAIVLHNRRSLPVGLNPEYLGILNLIRDADKLDIFRVLALELTTNKAPDPAIVLHTKNEPNKYSKNLVADVLAGRLVSFESLVYVNDFKILLGSWIVGINYPQSKKILLADGYYQAILQSILQITPQATPQDNADIKELCSFLLASSAS